MISTREVRKQNTSSRKLLILFVALLPLQVMQAQKLRMTVKAGANFSMVSGVGAQGFNHFGAHGGVMLNWRFARKFSFNPEVMYSMKGAQHNPTDASNYSFSIDLDYIEIPTLFRWHFTRRERLSLEFGPTFGFLVRNNAYENGLLAGNGPAFNLFDLSLALGLTYHMNKGWGLNIRYTNSIMPIQPFNAPPQPVGNITIGQVNSTFSASLLYNFGFKKRDVSKAIDPLLKTEKKEKKPRVKKQKGDIIDED